MGNLIKSVLEGIRERRMNIINGNINSIPSPFKRFKKDFIGIEQSQYVVITAPTKGAKSQFANFMYVFTPILYAYNNPNKLDIKIIYFTLEESKDRIVQRFMSFLLYHFSNGKIRVSPSELRSTDNDAPLSEEIIKILEEGPYNKILDFFEEHVEFISDDCNPTGMFKFCKNYAESQGKVIKRKVKYGIEEVEKFDKYIPNNPKLYKIIITDHVSLIDKERGFTDKQTIDKWSEYETKYLRNRYGFTCVDIQQQSFEGEGLEAQKMGKIEGSISSLGDSKYTARNANLVLGLFSPFKFELPSYKSYNIIKLRNNIRFLKVYINRDGGMGGVCPLFFDGATCFFKELPRPEQTEALEKVYKYLEKLKNNTTDKIFISYSKTIKKEVRKQFITKLFYNFAKVFKIKN